MFSKNNPNIPIPSANETLVSMRFCTLSTMRNASRRSSPPTSQMQNLPSKACSLRTASFGTWCPMRMRPSFSTVLTFTWTWTRRCRTFTSTLATTPTSLADSLAASLPWKCEKLKLWWNYFSLILVQNILGTDKYCSPVAGASNSTAGTAKTRSPLSPMERPCAPILLSR